MDPPLCTWRSASGISISFNSCWMKDYLNVPNHYGETPLHWAAKLANGAVIRALLEMGARHDIQDGDGNTPFHWACEYDNLEAAVWLLEYGANRDIRNDTHFTPLELAKREDSQRVLSIIVPPVYTKTSSTINIVL